MTSGGARGRWPLANASRSLVDVPAELSFAIGSRDVGTVVTEIVPVIDGVALTDRVHRFERETGMESREVSYGGLIPACFRFGPAEVHYRAAAGAFVEEAKIPLLGCVCGEWAAGRCCAGWSSTPAPSRGATSNSPTVASATTRVLARSSSIATTTRRRSQR